MTDIKKVSLFDPTTNVDFNINAAGELEVSVESLGVNVDSLDGYKVSDVDDDGSPNYYGFLRADGAWYIIKETLSAGANTYRYVKGASGYNWSNRASESYDTFDAIF